MENNVNIKSKKLDTWKLVLMCILIGLVLGLGLRITVGVPTLVEKHYVFTIDELERFCGSTHLVKQFGSDEWSVFVNVCKSGGYCKYNYIKLSDCLK